MERVGLAVMGLGEGQQRGGEEEHHSILPKRVGSRDGEEGLHNPLSRYLHHMCFRSKKKFLGKNTGMETAIATQGMEGRTVMVAMMGEDAVIIEMITVMEGIMRTVKEVSLKDSLTIELVVITIAKATSGITEKLGVDVVKESRRAEEVSNMKAWSSRAHLLAFLRLLHPKQLLNNLPQSAWKKRGW